MTNLKNISTPQTGFTRTQTHVVVEASLNRTVGPNMSKCDVVRIAAKLPHFSRGEIVKGFGRGSSELGFLTANFPQQVIDQLPEELVGGIYFGFAQVDNGPVHDMVMSIGWNPFYNNEKRAMETHIIHKFEGAFTEHLPH